MRTLDELHSFAVNGGKLNQAEKAWIKSLCQRAGIECKPSRCPSFWSDRIVDLRALPKIEVEDIDNSDNIPVISNPAIKLKDQFANGSMINGVFVDQLSITPGIYEWMCKLGLSHMFKDE